MQNMDLGTFYCHALQWKHQKDEADSQALQERTQAIREEWKSLAEAVREALPIVEMDLMETEAGQFENYPGHRFDVDGVLDPAMKEAVSHSRGELVRGGVIRVQIYQARDEQPRWQILKYFVKGDGMIHEFDNPYEAFLAAYQAMNSD